MNQKKLFNAILSSTLTENLELYRHVRALFDDFSCYIKSSVTD